MINFNELEDIIGYHFQNKELLITALTHSSYVNENKIKKPDVEDNERFEFFGDAIIEFYVSEYIFGKHEEFPEGELTKLRASMVCEQSLAECAKHISLGRFLRMGKGEARSGGRERASITSDAFEALTAAIYLDGGAGPVSEFVQRFLLKELENKKLFFDAKTRLQEIIQRDGGNVLSYELMNEEGPSHDKKFEIAAFLNGTEIGRGSGRSKKAAQQAAAESAIATLTTNKEKEI